MNVEPLATDHLATLEKLVTTVYEYIPQQLHHALPHPQCVKTFLTSFMDPVDSHFRKYGSLGELLDNLRIYQNFPMKYNEFETELQSLEVWKEFEREPFKFQCTKGEFFVRKIDVILHFHAKIYMKNVQEPKPIFEAMMKILTCAERSLEKCYDFCPYYPKLFDRIRDIVDGKETNGLQNFVKEYPALMKPCSISNKLPVVRVFVDNGHKFVMESEFFDNEIMFSFKKEQKENENGLIFSIDYDKVLKQFPNQVKDISFILVPINRAKHAAVPIVTPSGNHCLLASDILLEMFRRMISVFGIFQKFDVNEWKKITEIFHKMMSYFEADTESSIMSGVIVFMTTKKYKSMKQEFDEIWDNFSTEKRKNNKKNRRKACRTVGKFGFDANFLRDELKYLELIDAFPDICSVADSVYSEVFKSRKETFLRNCDLIDAVEQCQLICLLQRFKLIESFLHFQKSCGRIGCFNCIFCDSSSSSDIFKNSELNEFDCSDVVLRTPYSDDSRPERDWVLDLPNSTSIVSNFKFLTNEESLNPDFEHFLLDNDDIKWAVEIKKLAKFTSSKPISDKKSEEFLSSLQSISKAVDKKIYIPKIQTNGVDCVFVSDVLKIIPIVLKKQNNLTEKSQRILMYLSLKWKLLDVHIHEVIDLEEFKKFLEKFDINKSLITIVPAVLSDILPHPSIDSTCQQTLLRETVYLKATHSLIRTFSPRGNRVMHRDSTIFYFFMMVVSGIDWTTDDCETHPKCKNDLKKKIIEIMKEYKSMGEKDYISEDYVEMHIKMIKEHCSFKQEENKKYWKYRKQWFYKLLDAFFEKEESDLCEFIRKTSRKCIPSDEPEDNDEVEDTVDHKGSRQVKVMSEKLKYYKNLLKVKTMEADRLQVNQSIFEQKAEQTDAYRGLFEVSEKKNAESTELIENLKRQVQLLNDERQDGYKEKVNLINDTKKLLDRVEKTTKRLEEAERKLIELQNERDQLKTRHSEAIKAKCQQIEKMKAKNVTLTHEIASLKKELIQNQVEKNENEDVEQLKLTISQQTELLTLFTESMAKTTDFLDKVEVAIEVLEERQNNYKAEISEKDEDIRKLREFIDIQEADRIKMSNALEEVTSFMTKKHEEEKKLMNSLSNNFSFISPPSKNSQEGPSAYRSRLMGLQRIKDDLHRRSPLKLAKEMVERLISLSNRTEIHQMANYEYQQYEAKIWNYLQKVEASIEILKNSEDLSKLPRLPKPPSFSDKFIDKYWDEIKKEATENASDELTDADCLICFVEMLPEEKTLKCDECGKVVHLTCASKWHEIHRSCPHCRSNQLDPNEYPSLA